MASYTPHDGYATLVLRPEELQLNDVTDHHTGPLRITEITQRFRIWSVGGYGPDLRYARATYRTPEVPPLTRNIPSDHTLRVCRKVPVGTRLTGHAQQITSHNPRLRGCYTHVDGYNAACSCGWTSPDNAHSSRQRAREAFNRHQAQFLTDQTRDKFKNLAELQRLEEQLDHRLPWAWQNTFASADLTGMPEETLHELLARAAKILGVEVRREEEDNALTPWKEGGVYGASHPYLWVSPGQDDPHGGGWGWHDRARFEIRATLLPSKTDAMVSA